MTTERHSQKNNESRSQSVFEDKKIGHFHDFFVSLQRKRSKHGTTLPQFGDSSDKPHS
jgi:hypothetical protein